MILLHHLSPDIAVCNRFGFGFVAFVVALVCKKVPRMEFLALQMLVEDMRCCFSKSLLPLRLWAKIVH